MKWTGNCSVFLPYLAALIVALTPAILMAAPAPQDCMTETYLRMPGIGPGYAGPASWGYVPTCWVSIKSMR